MSKEKNHFSEVMAKLMYDGKRIEEKKSSPLLVSLGVAIKSTKDMDGEVVPTGELLREIKSNTRYLRYLHGNAPGSGEASENENTAMLKSKMLNRIKPQ